MASVVFLTLTSCSQPANQNLILSIEGGKVQGVASQIEGVTVYKEFFDLGDANYRLRVFGFDASFA